MSNFAIITRRQAVILGSVVAVGALVLDLLSKWWIVDKVMDPPRAIEIVPFFNLVMVWNSGITFGMFGNTGWGRWAFAGLALMIVGVLVSWLLRATYRSTALALGSSSAAPSAM